MTHKGVPGSSGQPEEEFQELNYNSMGAGMTTRPKTDYAEGNPLQETSPTEVKVWNNDSEEKAVGQTSNELNGGRSLQDGGGVG